MRHLDSNKHLERRITADLEACVDDKGRIEGRPCPGSGGLYELSIYRSKGRVIEQYRLNYERYLFFIVRYYELVVPDKGDCALREAA